MNLLKKVFAVLLAALVFTVPSFALAEGDFEQGDGWTYQNGELKIIENGALEDFINNEDPVTQQPRYKHTVYDVSTLVIGKNVTALAIDQAAGYPTLYYTAAYANEWAPNGETEWNGYPIQQISQEELNAILTEARGEEYPAVSASPVAKELSQAETPARDKSGTKPAPAMGVGTILLLTTGAAAIALVVIAISHNRKAKK